MRRRAGFTFIELLTVVLFIGLLAAMAVPRFREFKNRAYLALRAKGFNVPPVDPAA